MDQGQLEKTPIATNIMKNKIELVPVTALHQRLFYTIYTLHFMQGFNSANNT